MQANHYGKFAGLVDPNKRHCARIVDLRQARDEGVAEILQRCK